MQIQPCLSNADKAPLHQLGRRELIVMLASLALTPHLSRFHQSTQPSARRLCQDYVWLNNRKVYFPLAEGELEPTLVTQTDDNDVAFLLTLALKKRSIRFFQNTSELFSGPRDFEPQVVYSYEGSNALHVHGFCHLRGNYCSIRLASLMRDLREQYPELEEQASKTGSMTPSFICRRT